MLGGVRGWPFIIFTKSVEEMNMDARRHEGKEIQGLMRSLKDACGQYRNFLAGTLPENMWTSPEQRKHVQIHKQATGCENMRTGCSNVTLN